MRRMVRVRLHPVDGSIARALIERLLMFEVTLCLDAKEAKEIQERHATLLQAGIAEVVVSNDSDLQFEFFTKANTIQVNDSCSIVLHDVLPSGRNSGLVNEELESIWNAIEHSMDGDASHYWVAESDVVDALVAFLGMYQFHVAFRDQHHPARLLQSHQKALVWT